MSGYSFFAVRVCRASEPIVGVRAMYEIAPCTLPAIFAAFCPTVATTIASVTMLFYARVVRVSTVAKTFRHFSFLTPLRKRKRMFTCRSLKERKKERKKPSVMGDRIHVMAFSDLVALWVIRIKDWFFAHVVCRDHVTSSTKCRSHSESTLKVCFFSSQNNKIRMIKRWRHIFWEMNRCAKVCGVLFVIVLFGCWLAGQENCNHVVNIKQCFY